MPASRKRRRSSTSQHGAPGHARQEGVEIHEAFTGYARSRGVVIGSVKPAALLGRGIGLVATAPIKKNERVLFVPEKAMLKPNMPLLRQEGLDKATSPHAQLTFSLLAALQAKDSPLRAWEATWGTMHDFKTSIPLLWTQDLTGLLPPSVAQPLSRQRADFQKDVENPGVAKYLARHHLDAEQWAYYWLIVNNRCFHFKPPGSRPGFMVLCPFIDYLNHGPTGSGCVVQQSPRGYEVTADRDYEIGEELLATYGALPNEKLLVQYGFICSDGESPSVDDDVRLDHLILPELDSRTQEQLQDVGFLGAYALIPATNEICFKTQVAVRAVLLTATEWDYYITNGEDLSSDQTQSVTEWLRPLLEKYRKEASEKLQHIEAQNPTAYGALVILRSRWTQIRDAIDAFLREQ